MQDWLLPTAAYVGGPAEVAYLAQSSCLYDQLLGRMPVVVPRASMTLIEPRVERALRKYGLSLEDTLVSQVHLRGRIAAARIPRRVSGKLDKTQKRLEEMLASTRAAVEGLDGTLANAVETSRRKMLYQFEKMRGKVARAQAEQNGIVDRHTALLHNSLYPGRMLQERQVNFLSFVSRYGRSLVARLLEDEGLLSRDHRVIPL